MGAANGSNNIKGNYPPQTKNEALHNMVLTKSYLETKTVPLPKAPDTSQGVRL